MKHVTFLSWNEAPHLTAESRAELEKSIPPHQRRARMEGVPYLGAGAIYPVPLGEILVDPFVIPDFWPRCFGMDVGWNRTAVLWLALDRGSDVVYAYSEHYVGQSEPVMHAHAILGSGGNERAKWIPGVIDPASRGRSQVDGIQLFESYRALGLNIELADNSLEAGIYEVWQRLSSGKLKFFRTLTNLAWEYNIYRRDDKGKVIAKNNHLCDCLRYAIMSGLKEARPVPIGSTEAPDYGDPYAMVQNGWMAS